LSREAKNIEYIDGSNLVHSLNDQKDNNGPFMDKKLIGKAQFNVLGTNKQNSSSRIVLYIGACFKELDTPNYSSLSQIQGGLDVDKKKGKRNVCYPTIGLSPRKTRRAELVIPHKPMKTRKSKK
jgi:hypothetical protein